jgi:hypothetical protein
MGRMENRFLLDHERVQYFHAEMRLGSLVGNATESRSLRTGVPKLQQIRDFF